jgi:Raf kinase inhibitor-like YbhB/YbcL family protein
MAGKGKKRTVKAPSGTAREPIAPKGTVRRVDLGSPSFKEGERIPVRNTRDGANLSPALTWLGLPERTSSVALICDDPDAPDAAPFVHWIIYNVPPAQRAEGTEMVGLSEGISQGTSPAEVEGAVQGKNSFGTIGYDGPEPPHGHGLHHYHFTLYALDTVLDAQEGMTRLELFDDMRGHVIGIGETVGTYSR